MSQEHYAHFIGVGGAGMSGIALVLHERGVVVTGSDLKESRYSKMLADAGVEVHIGHAAANLGDPKVVVVSTAIPETNPELVEARARGLEVWPRARMLAHLADGRKTIAVAGTHGKTSTSSMVASMLSALGADPTFLIGGEVCGFGTNARTGSGEHFVVEADESDGSFVFLSPSIAVVTNIEADHLDHHGTLANVEDSFREFLRRTDEDGCVIVCGDDERALAAARAVGRRTVTYGFGSACDLRVTATERDGTGSSFRVLAPGGVQAMASVALPGTHMVSNAAAVLAVAWVLGFDLADAAEALGAFCGVRRRFDVVGEVDGVTVVDDYAHHPTEVDATLKAARGLGYERVWALFQPHRYSRTAAFAREFGAAFSDADAVVMMDVYSAGEAPVPGVSGKTVVDAILAADARSRVAWLPHRADVVPYLVSQVRPGDLVLTMGAGDVTQIGPELVRALQNTGA